MSEYERVPLEPWSAVADNLRAFAAGGEASESGEGIEIAIGDATLLVARDGRVLAEMPRHEFGAGDVSYEFRRPR